MPTRTCIVCRKKDEKENLIRIVAKENGSAFYDKNQKTNSRAIYLCRNESCLNLAIKLLEKGKIKQKIGINYSSLEVLLNEIKNELEE